MADTRARAKADPTFPLLRHPVVNELADIFAAAFALADRIRAYKAAHRGGCRCACCRYVKASQSGGPNVYDFLTAIEALIWSSAAAQEDRPMGWADAQTMNERDARQKGGA